MSTLFLAAVVSSFWVGTGLRLSRASETGVQQIVELGSLALSLGFGDWVSAYVILGLLPRAKETGASNARAGCVRGPHPTKANNFKARAMSEKLATADSFFASATRTWAAARTRASKLKSSGSIRVLAALIILRVRRLMS